METLGAIGLILGLVVFGAFYGKFLERVLPRIGGKWRWAQHLLPKPNHFCPRYEQIALQQVYYAQGRSNPPTPNFYLCQQCGARWQRLFKGPLKEATDAKYDYYFGPDVPYQYKGQLDNGKEPMTVVPF